MNAEPTFTGGPIRNRVTFKNLINSLSTGLVSGGDLSINVDPTMVDISAGTGVHVDNYSTPDRILSPVITPVSWDSSLITPSFLNSLSVTAIGVDKTGAIIQKPIDFTADDRRDFILLGRAVHPDLATVSSIDQQIFTPNNSNHNLVDLSLTVEAINVSGNKFYPNGANLRINKSSGEVFAIGVDYKTDKKSPNFDSTASLVQATFLYDWKDGAGGFNNSSPTQDIVSDKYDDGTGGVGLPNGVVPTGSWTVQKVFYVGGVENIVIHFGVNYYDSLLEAYNNINEEFDRDPGTEDLQFRGYILVRSSATDLSDPTQAMFVELDRFGTSIKGQNSILRTAHISCEISLPQSIPNGAGWTDLLWDAETNDKHNITHSTSVNKEIFTADTDMVVTISAQTMWQAAASKNYRIRILKNGSSVIAEGGDDSGTALSIIDSDVSLSNIRLLKGDTIKIQVQHSNGSPLDALVAGTYMSIQQDI